MFLSFVHELTNLLLILFCFLTIQLSSYLLTSLTKNEDSKLFLGWTLDMRSMIGDKKQDYSINGTSATYKQHNDLTNEISLLANMGYEKKFSEKSSISFSLDAKNTNQYTKSVGANISLSSKF